MLWAIDSVLHLRPLGVVRIIDKCMDSKCILCALINTLSDTKMKVASNSGEEPVGLPPGPRPRPELLVNITVYLCNNGIRFTKKFYPSALYFSPSLQF